MNLKKEKGITIVALIITVILMLILVGVGIDFGTDAINKARLEDIKTDMISIKTRAKIITEQYNFKDIEKTECFASLNTFMRGTSNLVYFIKIKPLC